MAVVVLELDPQAANVAVNDIALGHEVGAPHRVENLFSRYDAPIAAGEKVQEALLDAAEVNDRMASTDFSVHDVDHHLTELYGPTIGRWMPDARREITIERASSSSGEKGMQGCRRPPGQTP